MRKALVLCAALVALLAPTAALGAPSVLYGIQDDAWLAAGPGTLDDRLLKFDALGVDVVRFTLRWNEIAAAGEDPAGYDWSTADAVLNGLRAHGLAPVVTLAGTPAWANGGRPPNFAPSSAAPFATFAQAAASRYPWVRYWTIWNEPNQRVNLRPARPATYVRLLLNPGYAAIHAADPGALVAGGVTAPRAGQSGVSPIAWIRGMRAAHAHLDAYAHHPYPAGPFETPFSGGCRRCTAITMANLPVLLREVERDFGAKPVWLTEYGYQTNPPDRLLGVSPARQAAYIGKAALRAYELPHVTMLIHFLYEDEPAVGAWQSGLVTVAGKAKPALGTFPLPVAEAARRGNRVVLWGQVRPGSGVQTYRLEKRVSGRWRWLHGTFRTNVRGFFRRIVVAPPGTAFRAWSPAAGRVSLGVPVR
jgi:hypothetical protein